MVPRFVKFVLVGLILVMVIAGPIAYALYRDARTRNLHVVKERVLYRSGQMSLEGLKETIRDHRIKTVVTFRVAREEGAPHPDKEEEDYCRSQELNYYRIPTRSWVLDGDTAPADKSVERFCQIMQDPANFPVLVHCFAGKHRTGAYCAIYRMEFDRWSNDKAIREMKLNGYHNIEDHQDLFGYLKNYRPQGFGRKTRSAVPKRVTEFSGNISGSGL